MKKSIRTIAIAAFTLMGTMSFGQSLNFNGGFTMSTLKSSDMEDVTYTESFGGTTYTHSSKIKQVGGFNAAIGYEFRLGERLSLETGLKIQTRGYKTELDLNYDSGIYSERQISTVKYKYSYLDIPIVLNTAILTGDVRVYARTGIYAGFMAGARYQEKSEYTSSDGDNQLYEYSERMDGMDIEDRITGGFILGAGVEYKGFYFEANYNLGMLSLANPDYEIYSNDFSFSLGYKLKFKK